MASQSWKHNPIAQVAGAPAAAGEPGSFVWANDKTQHVIYRGADNQIHELWLRRGMLGQSSWAYGGALTQKTGAQPAVSDPDGFAWEGDDTQHILYRGLDGQVHELWQRKGKEWKYGGALNSRLGAPPALGKVRGFAWESDGTQHVIYRGTDSQVHELYQHRGKEWAYGGALNLKAGAPPAAGDPFGFAWESDGTQHVVYRGGDNHIHELWYRKSTGWRYDGALSARFGGPPAAGDPAYWVWKHDGTQHIIYRGLENQVHELWYRHAWAYGGALNARAGGPPLAGNPMGYAWERDDTQHVIYRGVDTQIHELWQKHGKEWKYGGILSVITGAPAAAGDPDGFAWEGDDTQHIVYRGVDNQIHELWQR